MSINVRDTSLQGHVTVRDFYGSTVSSQLYILNVISILLF